MNLVIQLLIIVKVEYSPRERAPTLTPISLRILELLFSWRISALSKRAREKERENDRKRDVLQSMSEATRLVVRHAAANLN